jgi:hypothetical protein
VAFALLDAINSDEEKGSDDPMDTRLAGLKCRSTKPIRSHRGVVGISTEGTIQHDIYNLGRRLISVQWDGGITDYVFPSEIEIIHKRVLVIRGQLELSKNARMASISGSHE